MIKPQHILTVFLLFLLVTSSLGCGGPSEPNNSIDYLPESLKLSFSVERETDFYLDENGEVVERRWLRYSAHYSDSISQTVTLSPEDKVVVEFLDQRIESRYGSVEYFPNQETENATIIDEKEVNFLVSFYRNDQLEFAVQVDIPGNIKMRSGMVPGEIFYWDTQDYLFSWEYPVIPAKFNHELGFFNAFISGPCLDYYLEDPTESTTEIIIPMGSPTIRLRDECVPGYQSEESAEFVLEKLTNVAPPALYAVSVKNVSIRDTTRIQIGTVYLPE